MKADDQRQTRDSGGQRATVGGPMDEEPAFTIHRSTIAIVGLGLMGGSLALALKAQNPAGASGGKEPRLKILGITRSRATLDKALARGAIDDASDQLSRARNADLIILAAPVRTILQQIPRLVSIARDGALILDLGSTKRAIVEALNQLPARLLAVGGHPMCGKETSGFEAADDALYQDKTFVLTPTARSNEHAVGQARALAETVGARVVLLDATRHDEIVAATSHLPFLVASNLVATLDALPNGDGMLMQLAASGYRDTTRLAASDTRMMLDILLTNRENVAAMMRRYSRAFGELADLINAEDDAKLRERLEYSAQARRGSNDEK